MVFCTKCGCKIEPEHAFCASCGTAASRPAGPERAAESTPEEPLPQEEYAVGLGTNSKPPAEAGPPSIDRKTLFANGMLVLTNTDLVLYSNDEQDELMRIPVNTIVSCDRGITKRSLVIKRMTNIEERISKKITGYMSPR